MSCPKEARASALSTRFHSQSAEHSHQDRSRRVLNSGEAGPPEYARQPSQTPRRLTNKRGPRPGSELRKQQRQAEKFEASSPNQELPCRRRNPSQERRNRKPSQARRSKLRAATLSPDPGASALRAKPAGAERDCQISRARIWPQR
jgi:hypothetical protein